MVAVPSVSLGEASESSEVRACEGRQEIDRFTRFLASLETVHSKKEGEGRDSVSELLSEDSFLEAVARVEQHSH